ncbi:hypothetical protein [Cohnella terricola]|uniref:Uncharacterized protein n=1 Tax=Cohnella terricola TaxID=1289167 RepID=A0A559JQK8_9BACL|nr:hypothetical protein [Cohnella terricola]TVY02162.1 hypothetical protein FPZ45_06890 [Cohnella terricola]
MEERIVLSMARVSGNGLLINGKVYSSPLMMKEAWFSKARKEGEWLVPVLINLERTDEVIVIILEVALSITKPVEFQVEIQQAYYKALQNLKDQLFKMTKRRKKPKKK